MKNLPHSLDAERAVLGAMLVSRDALLNSVVRLSIDEIYPFIAKYEDIKERITDPEVVKPVVEKIRQIKNSFDKIGEYVDQFFDDEE